jgi:hypothetical protein
VVWSRGSGQTCLSMCCPARLESSSNQGIRLKRDMRAALLASKRAIDSKASSNREELLRSSVLKQTRMSDGKTSYVTKYAFSEFSLMHSQRGCGNECPAKSHGCLERDNGIDAERIRAVCPIYSDAWLANPSVLLRVARLTHDCRDIHSITESHINNA